MRKRQSFLLTLIPAEDNHPSIHGKITTIASGRTTSFTNIDELYELLRDELADNPTTSEGIQAVFPAMSSSSSPRMLD